MPTRLQIIRREAAKRHNAKPLHLPRVAALVATGKPPRKPSHKYWKGRPLHLSAAAQIKYTSAIDGLVKQMTTEVKAELIDLFNKDFAKEHFGLDASETVGMDAAGIGSQARILLNKFKARFDQLFSKSAGLFSDMMVNDVNKSSADGVNAAIKSAPVDTKTLAKRLTINLSDIDKPTEQLLKTATARSSSFITSIPETYLNKVSDAVFDSIATGNGLQDLVPFLEKQGSQIENWAHNTALDQTRKAYNGLNAGRMKNAGIEKGEWIHSGGSQHPRPEHEAFDGKTFDLAKGAPIGDDGGDVMPGDDPNCRCTFAPVIAYGPEDDEEDEE